MTAGRNWDRSRDQARLARQGSEPAAGMLFPPSAPPKIRPSKASLRAEAEAAFAAARTVLKRLACSCGHSATIRLTPAQAERGRFRCKCGRPIP